MTAHNPIDSGGDGGADDDTTTDEPENPENGENSNDGPFLKRLAKNPRGAIMGIVLVWVVDRITSAGAALFGAAVGYFKWLGGVYGESLVYLTKPFTVTITSVVGLYADVHESLVAAIGNAGILAPAAATVAVGLEVFMALVLADLLIRLGLLSVLSSIPVLGGVFNALGRLYLAIKRVAGSLYRGVL